MLAHLRGAVALLLLVLNTLAWSVPLLALAVLKWLAVAAPLRARLDPLLNATATGWIRCNNFWMSLLQPTRWDVRGVETLSAADWYLVCANHQSWVDIFALQRVLSGRIPLLKFFLKRELIYVPVIGLAWWALDFPFLHRGRRSAGRADRNTARRSCQRFALAPTSVTNFLEGTRWSVAKHRAQGSPYERLLRPKTGAMAAALDTLGDRLHGLVDVTIFYPEGPPSFWRFLCGQVPRVSLRIREVAIPAQLRSNAAAPALQAWLHALWQDKDAQLEQLFRDMVQGRGRNAEGRT